MFVLREYESKSEPGMFHQVGIERGKLICTCKGFMYHGHCWHLDSVPKLKEELVRHGVKRRVPESLQSVKHCYLLTFQVPDLEDMGRFRVISKRVKAKSLSSAKKLVQKEEEVVHFWSIREEL